MIVKPLNHPRRSRELPVAWQNSAWFPVVHRLRATQRRRVNWAVQIITDPTVCRSRAFFLIEL